MYGCVALVARMCEGGLVLGGRSGGGAGLGGGTGGEPARMCEGGLVLGGRSGGGAGLGGGTGGEPARITGTRGVGRLEAWGKCWSSC